MDGVAQGEAGDDDIRVSVGFFTLIGGPGLGLADAMSAGGASVAYLDHTTGVTVHGTGLDDGLRGEGDNVLGQVGGITGSRATTSWRPKPVMTSIFGDAGNDTDRRRRAEHVLSAHGTTSISGGEGTTGRGRRETASSQRRKGLDEWGMTPPRRSD